MVLALIQGIEFDKAKLTKNQFQRRRLLLIYFSQVKRIEISPKEFTSPLLHKTHPSNVQQNLATWPQKTAVPPLSP